MFNINRTLKKGVRYPDKELLCDYQDLHFADLVSTPAVRAMSGIDNTIELGDSGYWYMITFDLSLIGQSRKENLMEFCDKFAQEIEIALPRMSKKYKDFYQYFLEDKKKNGVKFSVVPYIFVKLEKNYRGSFPYLFVRKIHSKNYYVILTTRRVSEIWKKNTLEISY